MKTGVFTNLVSMLVISREVCVGVRSRLGPLALSQHDGAIWFDLQDPVLARVSLSVRDPARRRVGSRSRLLRKGGET